MCQPPLTQGATVKRLNRLALLLVPVLTAVVAPPAKAAPGPVLKTLLSRELPEHPGKELLSITVEYPPGGSDPVHRHDAHAFVYVLEGSVVMGLRGGREVTLAKGQTFYEAPGDVHTVSRNASSTKPAKFLVVFLKDKGTDSVLPARGKREPVQ
ncbi:cupin domain-containing protein [Ramlibacter sp. B156]|uniref:Cupin domain-containing protein n=1 Tax=Ramlibacter montanisoli TaxID=2732512 RepID=A0A849KAB6_9BURK|nr:cupin domain-containing protein [Ramlibacter montanisoli]